MKNYFEFKAKSECWSYSFAAGIALFIFGIGSTDAASFDCVKASTKSELAICASPTISKLDSELAAVYKRVLEYYKGNEEIKSSQRDWLKATRDKCSDHSCLVLVYETRITAYRSALDKLGVRIDDIPTSVSPEEAVEKPVARAVLGTGGQVTTEKLRPNSSSTAKKRTASRDYACEIQAKLMLERAQYFRSIQYALNSQQYPPMNSSFEAFAADWENRSSLIIQWNASIQAMDRNPNAALATLNRYGDNMFGVIKQECMR